jgi:predicted GIY-YIG superfamily endonuclease
LSKPRVSKNGRRLGHIIGSVYLVHMARSLNGARHYLGFSTNVPQRVKAHKAGRGTPLLGEATKKGISWRVVRTWRKRDGYFEQDLKRRYALADLCPVCSRKGRR